MRNLVLVALAAAAAACASTARPRVEEPGAIHAPRDSGGTNRPEHRDAPYVVLVSIDGFRADYVDRFDLPNVRRVVQRGARARAMTPVFPTLTFPNHYSLVTGLHPERHGIVANSFFDPARGQSYALNDRATVSDGTWYRGEPIWVTAERQGMVTASFFWPGSEAAIGGVRPSTWRVFDAAIPNGDRVAGVLEWLRRPIEQRPHFVTLYFNELDTVSHRAPLDAPQIERAAQSVDRALGALLDGLEDLPIGGKVYVVLVSDHGMVDTSPAYAVRLDALIDTAGIRVGFSGPVTALHVGGDAGRARQVRGALNARLQHGRAYLREELPERWRFRADPRAGDVVVVMEEPWRLVTGAESRTDRYGMHGWDPALDSMQALFAVSGPGIEPGTVVPRVRNVDVYPFLTELLGLRPARQIDGRAGGIRERLNQSLVPRSLVTGPWVTRP